MPFIPSQYFKIALFVGLISGPFSELFVANRGLASCGILHFDETFHEGLLKAPIVARVGAPKLDHPKTIEDFQKHNNKLVLLDYDGTMVPFVDNPELAVPDRALLEVLDKLDRDPTTNVAIITGRDQKFVEKHFGKYSSFHLSAEYGAMERGPAGEWRLVEGLDLGWLDSVDNMMKNEIKNYKVDGTVSVERKVTTAVLHYRKLYDSKIEDKKDYLKKLQQFFNLLKKKNNMKLLGSNALTVENDNLAIEVRMGEALSKGQVVERVLRSLPNTDMVLCFGDSNSDEEMFKTLGKLKGLGMRSPDVLTTVHVDNGKGYKTLAQHKMSDPQEFSKLFRGFYDLESTQLSSHNHWQKINLN